MPRIPLTSTAGRLAALFDPGTGEPPRSGPTGALVCHPHPLHGGTMDNKVVFSLAKVFRERGLATLRFNFRGAGGSEGEHDGGRGEREDVAAALDALASRCDGPLLVAGFSFGSWVGLSTGLEDPRVVALMAVAPPVNHYDYGAVASTGLPLAVAYARDDELVPASAVEAWLATCRQPPRITPVVGASHLFHGKLAPLRAAAGSFLTSLQEPPKNG